MATRAEAGAPPSYDARQLAATLVSCLRCRRAFYMTRVILPCFLCQEGR